MLWDCGAVERGRGAREVPSGLADGVPSLPGAADAILERSGERSVACRTYGNGRRRAAA